eukprot:jgi/Bigna1/68919/fgenesh1_pg.7_\
MEAVCLPTDKYYLQEIEQLWPRVFKAFDADKNGVVDSKEILAMRSRGCEKVLGFVEEHAKNRQLTLLEWRKILAPALRKKDTVLLNKTFYFDCLRIFNQQMNCASTREEANYVPLRDMLDAELRSAKTTPDWEGIAKRVGRVVLMRRPYREIRLASRLVPMESKVKWKDYEKAFVFAGNLMDEEASGSRAQSVSVDIHLTATREGGEVTKVVKISGLKSMTAAIIDMKDISRVRIIHKITQYETRLVSYEAVAKGIASELDDRFEPVAPEKLDPKERERYLWNAAVSHAGDSKAMLSELCRRGLHRPEGMPDYFFVQQLARRIYSHIQYHAGKDMQNNGKPPSHAFKTGYGQCGRYSAVMVSACRSVGIPARLVTNIMRESEVAKWHPSTMHACAEAYIEGAGWVLIEPQNGNIGDFTNYVATDTIPPLKTSLDDARVLHPALGGQVDQTVDYYFGRYDKDKSNSIGGRELVDLLKEALAIQGSDDTQLGSAIDECLHALDVDGDGEIDKKELKAAFLDQRINACGRAYTVLQSTCGASLLKLPKASSLSCAKCSTALFEGELQPGQHNWHGPARTYKNWQPRAVAFSNKVEFNHASFGRFEMTVSKCANCGESFGARYDFTTISHLIGQLVVTDAKVLAGSSTSQRSIFIPGNAAEESRVTIYPAYKERVKLYERCGFPAGKDNPLHESNIRQIPSPVASLEFDRVIAHSLRSSSGRKKVGIKETDWGKGDEIV